MESKCISLFLNTSWPDIDSSFELGKTIVGNFSVFSYFNLSLSLSPFARTINGYARIIWLKFHSFLFIPESPCFKTSITLFISLICRASNKLLFRKFKEFASFKEMSTLHSSSGGESPTRSKLTLVLKSIRSTFCSPVYWVRNFISRKLNNSGLRLVFVSKTTKHSSVFFVSSGRVFVVIYGERTILSIFDLDLRKDSIPELKLSICTVWEPYLARCWPKVFFRPWLSSWAFKTELCDSFLELKHYKSNNCWYFWLLWFLGSQQKKFLKIVSTFQNY